MERICPQIRQKGSSHWWQTKAKHLCSSRFNTWKGTQLQYIVLHHMFPPIQVGVGTCNVGGKGMTGYVQPKGYTKATL